MEHWALTIFSIFVQAAVGLIVLISIGRLVDKNAVYKTGIITSVVLAVVGLVAAFFHLGRPIAAIYALTGFSHSWLSREIWFVMIFIGLSFLAAGLLQFKPESKGGITALLISAAVIGLVAIYGMGSVYATTSIPFWQHFTTYVGFFVAAMAIGAALFLAFSSKEAGKYGTIIALCVPLALIACAAVTMTYYIQLGSLASTAIQETLLKLKSMSPAIIVQWIFALTGSGLLYVFTRKEGKAHNGIYVAAALVIVGLFIGRYVFYAAEVVMRVGLH